MTPLDVSDGIAEYLMNELRKLNENSDVTERPIRVWSGFLPRVDKNEDKRKLCPAVVVHPYSVSDADSSTVGITVLVTTYDEALTEGHVGLYHLLEVVRERLLSDNPVALKYEIKENTINTTIPDDQPYPQWVGYLEFEVYIPVIRRNLNKIFMDNKVIE
nr:MAG TPA: tail completion protein [Caudoviricetes sp.]